MSKMNQKLKLPQIQQIMSDFERQNETMNLKQDMMSDEMDDVLADDEDEDEEAAVLGAVFAELGVELQNKMIDTPTLDVAMQSKGTAAESRPAALPATGTPTGASIGGTDLDDC